MLGPRSRSEIDFLEKKVRKRHKHREPLPAWYIYSMLLRKKVVTFTRLGGKLSVVSFTPSMVDQDFKKSLSQKHPPFLGAPCFLTKRIPPSLGRWNFFLTFFLWTLHVEYWAKHEFLKLIWMLNIGQKQLFLNKNMIMI